MNQIQAGGGGRETAAWEPFKSSAPAPAHSPPSATLFWHAYVTRYNVDQACRRNPLSPASKMSGQPTLEIEVRVYARMDDMAMSFIQAIVSERVAHTREGLEDGSYSCDFEHLIPPEKLKAYFDDDTLRRQCKCPLGCRLASEQSACGWYSCDGCGLNLEDLPRHCCFKHDFDLCQDCLQGCVVIDDLPEKPGKRRPDAHKNKTKHTKRADRSGFGGKHRRSRHAKWALLVD